MIEKLQLRRTYRDRVHQLKFVEVRDRAYSEWISNYVSTRRPIDDENDKLFALMTSSFQNIITAINAYRRSFRNR